MLWNGDVCRCAIDHEEMVVGNVRHDSFAAIWNGPKSREIVRRIVDGRFAKCASCAFSGRELIEKEDELLVL